MYRDRYWTQAYFDAINKVKEVGDKHGLTLPEIGLSYCMDTCNTISDIQLAALRWVSHHSLMKREYGDSVIIGASSLNHIEQNLIDLEKGPLRE
jgi:aflatoxin B1 aldehyde reductase